MPTVAVYRDDLFTRLGREYTRDDFDKLCFQFGIELDDVMTESQSAGRSVGAPTSSVKGSASAAAVVDRVLYYIAVPANRYDLLCIEGIARALNVYLERMPVPVSGIHTTREPRSGSRNACSEEPRSGSSHASRFTLANPPHPPPPSLGLHNDSPRRAPTNGSRR